MSKTASILNYIAQSGTAGATSSEIEKSLALVARSSQKRIAELVKAGKVVQRQIGAAEADVDYKGRRVYITMDVARNYGYNTGFTVLNKVRRVKKPVNFIGLAFAASAIAA